MSNYTKRIEQDDDDINDEDIDEELDDDDFFENMSEENRELLERAFLIVAELETRMIDKAFMDIEIPPPSEREKDEEI